MCRSKTLRLPITTRKNNIQSMSPTELEVRHGLPHPTRGNALRKMCFGPAASEKASVAEEGTHVKIPGHGAMEN